MPRLNPVNRDTADSQTTELLDAVQQKMGSVPNLISTMAQSPAVAQAYLGFSQQLSSGTLPAKLREQIALVVGETNSCEYCVSAHTVLGKMAGLSEEEAADARRAIAADEKVSQALQFARRIVNSRGQVSDEDVEQVRRAGYTEGEIAEVVANVALNLFTNYFNHVAGTDVDFPKAPELAAA